MPQLQGRDIGRTGFGLMGLTWRNNPCSTEQAFEAMKTALETGANFWNGGEFYGPPERNSLQLLNEYFTQYPEDSAKVVLSIKGGMGSNHGPDASADNTRRSVDNCLRLLDGKKKLDLFEHARVDPQVPIEVSIRVLAEYIRAGKLGGICLSECSANSIRRAAKIHKIEAVEVEFSLFATEILENGVAKTCGELDIPIIAYSPLSRGFLDDMRRHLPRFQKDNFDNNMKLVGEVEQVAKRKGCTVGNVAIAWVKAQSGKNGLPEIIPIPGATTKDRVTENNTDVRLNNDDLKELDEALKRCEIKGDRYPSGINDLNFGDSPEEK
ncbi:hypothetical protein FH972_021907 [Carpinus fangiana]|uniref:NADP-dependent oxidoreductase domain-containing protein n=1 Tax=Carpinus fangiana TaxID=176857 RepID=A0A5N6KR18_9ROSI|nr:hypothetical protein FH972_021907 [Carpinus fangiana]